MATQVEQGAVRASSMSPCLPPGGPLRRTWRARFALVCVGFLCSMVALIGVTSGNPAQALALPPLPVLIGETAAAPAAEVLAGGACATTLVCGAIVGAAALSIAAYATRDSWVPAVKGWLSGLFGGQRDDHASSFFAVGVTVQGNAITYNVSQLVVFGDFRDNWQIFARNLSCATNGTVGGLTGINGPSYRGPASGSLTLCGAGQTIATADIFAYDTGTNSTASNIVSIVGAVPAEQLSQTTTVHCSGGSAGSAGANVSASQAGAVADGQVLVPSCQAAYPGSVPTHIGVTGGSIGHETSQLSTDLTNPASQYPDCFDSAGAFLGTCRIRVWINGQPCTIGASHCGNWTTASQDYGDQVECKWGSYVVQIGDCDLLQRQYQPNASPKKLDKTTKSGVPVLEDDPAAAPAADPAPPPAPSPKCWDGCIFAPPADPGNPTVPGVPPVDKATPPDSQSCLGTGYSWNPVSWVYVPVKCALKWAFVPPPGSLDTLIGGLKAKWDATAPAQWLGAVQGLSPGPGTSGCEGLPLNVDLPHGLGVHQHLGEACSGTSASAAAVCRIALSAVAVVGGAFACVRALGSGLGWSPGVGKVDT